MIGQIVDLAIDCIRSYVVPASSPRLVEDFRWRCQELIENDIERSLHEHPPPGIAAPPPRAWADAWDHARHFMSPRTVAQAEALVDQIHNTPMTATEVRRRQAEHTQEQQQRIEVRHHEFLRREAMRQVQRAQQAAITDLALLGQSQIRIEPGAVVRVPPEQWQDLQPELGEDRAEPEPPTPEIEAKAKDILWSYLNKGQRKDLFCLNFFRVTGCMTGLVYRIVPGMQGNIYRDDGARYCVTNPSLPSWDLLLAQKLMLEDDEGKFLTLARRLDLAEVAEQPELETVAAMTRAVLGGPTPCDFAAGEISPELRRPGRSVVQILRDSIRLNR